MRLWWPAQGGNTAASAIFGGAVRSEIRAKSQQAKPSANVEPFTLLTLGILDREVKTLADAITAFTAPETLDGTLLMLLSSVLVLMLPIQLRMPQLKEDHVSLALRQTLSRSLAAG